MKLVYESEFDDIRTRVWMHGAYYIHVVARYRAGLWFLTDNTGVTPVRVPR